MTAHNTRATAGIKFLREHVEYQGDDCVIWPFSRLEGGYGNVSLDGTILYAHRLMCQLAHGPAPTLEHEAAHSCNTRPCINPNHVSWKTPSANQLDRKIHGTVGSGRKLTKKEWTEIRELKGILTQREIAAIYGVSFQNVSHLHRSASR